MYFELTNLNRINIKIIQIHEKSFELQVIVAIYINSFSFKFVKMYITHYKCNSNLTKYINILPSSYEQMWYI